jgi:hypothetical protein
VLPTHAAFSNLAEPISSIGGSRSSLCNAKEEPCIHLSMPANVALEGRGPEIAAIIRALVACTAILEE